jgi:prepilin-type N-terminal cleavage/methylation domain-containing protein
MKSRRGSAGFSLLEIMIAIVIIAVALMGILSATIYNSNAKESLRELEVAKQAADRKIDELRSLPWGSFKSPIVPSVVNMYVQDWLANGKKIPYNVNLVGLSPFSVDNLSSKSTVDKLGKGTIIIHGVEVGNSAITGLPIDPVYLVDVEVLIEWTGLRGASRYSSRMMLAKDYKK